MHLWYQLLDFLKLHSDLKSDKKNNILPLLIILIVDSFLVEICKRGNGSYILIDIKNEVQINSGVHLFLVSNNLALFKRMVNV